MSYFERGRATKAAFYTAIVLISFILVVVFIIRFPEIAFPIMFLGFAAIAILALWYFIYKTLK
jgi:hypothetical protein